VPDAIHIQPGASEIQFHLLAVPYQVPHIGLDQRQPQVESVPEKDAGKAWRDDRRDADHAKRPWRILAGRAAPEIASRHQDIARPHFSGKLGARFDERVLAKLRLRVHVRRISPRDNLIGIHVIAKQPYSGHGNLLECSRGDDVTGQGGGCSRLGRPEVHTPLWRPHPPAEVPVSCRKAHFARTDDAHMTADTWPTAGRPDRCASFQQSR